MYEQNYGRIVFTSSGSGIFGNFGQSNYGAAKMGMLGLMNVLAKEGANHNVRVNTLAPGASTRMTNTVPGRDENIEEPAPDRHPKLVSPAVLFMCSEDAPNGVVIHATGGTYSRSEIVVNEPVDLGPDATYEDLAAAGRTPDGHDGGQAPPAAAAPPALRSAWAGVRPGDRQGDRSYGVSRPGPSRDRAPCRWRNRRAAFAGVWLVRASSDSAAKAIQSPRHLEVVAQRLAGFRQAETVRAEGHVRVGKPARNG